MKVEGSNDVEIREIGDALKCSIRDCEICNLERYLNQCWKENLREEFSKKYFENIKSVLHKEKETFYPNLQQIFQALNMCPLESINVVIIGQDPYHNPGQAMGLSFSVPKNMRIPPSLINIFSELKEDIKGFKEPKHGDLRGWASQGVLLLNDVLTVAKNKPSSHSNIGWKHFTTKILEIINRKQSNVVFMLWGNHARGKASMIDKSKHLVLECGHPSPFSVKLFRGSRHFSKANEYLASKGKTKIDWSSL